MNILSNIDDYAGKSIVPILCGDIVQGTGFFVSPKHVLTANHIVAESIVTPSIPIQIKVEDTYVVCNLKSNAALPDYAILECVDYESPEDYVLEVVGGKFRKNQQCVIIGFPIELGNGQDYYAVEVKNVREKSDLKGGFDRLVVRTDSFGFNSYSGFSGSPVINKAGKVIGIQTDQLYNSLGYASISSFITVLESELGKSIESDDALFDDTTYGLGTAKKITEAQYERGKYRFKKNLHVEMPTVESAIESFCGFGFKEKAAKIHSDFCEWYYKLTGKDLQIVVRKSSLIAYFGDGKITDILRREIYELLESKDDNSYSLSSDLRGQLSIINWAISELQMWKRRFKDCRFMYICGEAGTGKSHLLYRESVKISEMTHVYLFQGMQFKEGEPPLDTICNCLGWTDENPLGELNKSLEKDGRTAVFIIDAINEGAGRAFWKDALPALKEKISAYSHLKLLVSIRVLKQDDELNNILEFDHDWERETTSGFSEISKAFQKYFEAYEIKDDYSQYLKIDEFTNPLFMKIFCETYSQLTTEERHKALRLPIYAKYLKHRNIDVSRIVDEDPCQNITSKLVQWVANQSVMLYDCGNVPRQSVYKRARRISMYRPWSHSLLFACLNSSVLKEYTSSIDGNEYIEFEYESLGDYLKAGCLLDRNISDKDKLDYLLRLFKILDNKNAPEVLRSKILSFLQAFLSIWNPNEGIWNADVFQKGCLTSILLSVLHNRNVRDEENTLHQAHIDSILEKNPDYREPELILNNFEVYSKGLFAPVHDYLISLGMNVRDEVWTTKVNALYNWAQYDELISKIEPKSSIEVFSLLQIEAWMLTSSYPYIRYYITRKLQNLLSKNPKQIVPLIKTFYCVDDNYILIGLYSSVYGAITSIQNVDLIVIIGQTIYNCHFVDGKAPIDIKVRHWALKIFEYIRHVKPDNELWDNAQPPYTYPNNLFEIVGENDYDQENFFGESMGSKRLNHSLYHWDFSRYIIGTNSATHSREFFIDENTPVSLSFIENAIAYLIKEKYGWNDRLGEYDTSVPYQTRHDKTVERIGKKYQWLALNEVYAYLCDVCKVKVNIWSSNEHFAEVNYPWYVEEEGYYDPTLPAVNIAKAQSYNMFDVLNPESTLKLDEETFINEGMNHTLLYFTVTDKSGEVWVSLLAYSKMLDLDEDKIRERFVFYNPLMVPDDNVDEFKEWMSSENFYGRWMPEFSGSIDFRWNEFPWADSYKVLGLEDDEIYIEKGHQFKLPYFAQLQETTEGYPEDLDYLSTAYMPCADMMEKMQWHTAERGIIRDLDQNIVAINRCMSGDPMSALFVKKSELDKYLTMTHQTLFYALLGELVVRVNYNYKGMTRLTGAAMYSVGSGVNVIQPLRKEPEAVVDDTLSDDDIVDLSQFLPENVVSELKEKKKTEILKALSDFRKETRK